MRHEGGNPIIVAVSLGFIMRTVLPSFVVHVSGWLAQQVNDCISTVLIEGVPAYKCEIARAQSVDLRGCAGKSVVLHALRVPSRLQCSRQLLRMPHPIGAAIVHVFPEVCACTSRSPSSLLLPPSPCHRARLPLVLVWASRSRACTMHQPLSPQTTFRSLPRYNKALPGREAGSFATLCCSCGL